jgi:hypothetical protein
MGTLPRSAVLTSAERFATVAVVVLAAVVALPYFGHQLGFGFAPTAVAIAAAGVGVITFFAIDGHRVRLDVDVLLLAAVGAGVFALLVTLTWPALLPPGSGPDLTHHLVLVDYIERQHHLVRDPLAAGGQLGEMAHYTPGLHILAVVAGRITGTDGFHAIYPVVGVSVALKFGVLALVLLRVLNGSPWRVPGTIAGVTIALSTSAYSIGSFTQDSFLAQVVAELFALVMWWAVLVWDRTRATSPLAVFAVAGMAAFLTWPVWIGPPLLTLALLLVWPGPGDGSRWRQATLAVVPIVVVALVHLRGRAGWLSLVGTSGAVPPPSLAALVWWSLLLGLLGSIVAFRDRRAVSLALFTCAIVTQALALWAVARARDASTPYMAFKMVYLLIYPAAVSAIVALDRLPTLMLRGRSTGGVRTLQAGACVVTVVLAGLTARQILTSHRAPPIVSDDLWNAGRWARDSLPADCVDYLVGSEYTAYWLHLAVLRHPRASARTGDDKTFSLQATMERWLGGEGRAYAIADLAILPMEVRQEVDVVEQFGEAAVIARRGGVRCP